MSVDPHADGCVLKVRAAPGASRERVVGIHGNALKVAVAAPPEKGRANARLAEVLAAALGVPSRAVVLLRGGTSRDKSFLLRGLDVAAARARVEACLQA